MEKSTSSMSTFLTLLSKILIQFNKLYVSGRYQGNCKPSGSQPKGHGGLNEQGVHHVAVVVF